MKKFEEPMLDIQKLEIQDVITTSDADADDFETERG